MAARLEEPKTNLVQPSNAPAKPIQLMRTGELGSALSFPPLTAVCRSSRESALKVYTWVKIYDPDAITRNWFEEGYINILYDDI